MNKKYIIISFICIIISLVSGIISNDIIVGGTILATGLLCAYFASEGKRLNYILGLINYLLMGYVSLKNNLYGFSSFMYLFFLHFKLKGL